MHPEQTALEQRRDLMSCDPDELMDLRDIHIDTSLPVWERMKLFVQQIRNPYLFKVDGLIVKTSYLPQAKRGLSDAITGLLSP